MSDHLIDRPIRLLPCHGCHRHVLAAIDGGLTVAADPQPVTIVQEIMARLNNHPVFDIITTGTAAYLIYRDLTRVRHPRGYPVVAAHQCPRGAAPRYQLIPPKTKATKKKAAKPLSDPNEPIPF